MYAYRECTTEYLQSDGDGFVQISNTQARQDCAFLFSNKVANQRKPSQAERFESMTAAESRLSAEGEYDDTIERTMPVIEAEKEVRFV